MPNELHLAKYIILDRGGAEYPLVFPIALQHSEMVPAAAKPVSAGFYQILDAETLLVGGESTSLKLSSRPQDRPLLQQLLSPTAS